MPKLRAAWSGIGGCYGKASSQPPPSRTPKCVMVNGVGCVMWERVRPLQRFKPNRLVVPPVTGKFEQLKTWTEEESPLSFLKICFKG